MKRILLALLVAGCGRGGDSPAAPDLAAARASLLEADGAFASRAAAVGWNNALLATLADDGFVARGTAAPGRGPDAVRRELSTDTLLATATATWQPIRWDVSADGRDGYSYGYVDATRPDGRAFPGKYSAYWRRGGDGGWKVVGYRRTPRGPGEITAAPAGFGPPADSVYSAYPPADAAALADSVAANERAFSDLAQTAGIGAAFAAFAAPDGANLGGGPGMVWGREAIAAQFDGYPADQGFTWEPDVVEVAASGDLAMTTGPVYPLAGPDGARPAPIGRYFSIWRRQPDGSWKYVIDG